MQTNVSWMQARTLRVVYVLQSNLNRCFRWQAISNLLPGLCTVNVWSKNSDLRRMLSVNIYFGLLLNYVNIQEHAEFIFSFSFSFNESPSNNDVLWCFLSLPCYFSLYPLSGKRCPQSGPTRASAGVHTESSNLPWSYVSSQYPERDFCVLE